MPLENFRQRRAEVCVHVVVDWCDFGKASHLALGHGYGYAAQEPNPTGLNSPVVALGYGRWGWEFQNQRNRQTSGRPGIEFHRHPG